MSLEITITKEQLEIICEAAQKYGITHFKLEELEMEFDPPQPRIVYTPPSLKNQPIGEAHGMPTDDQLLFASSIPMSDEELAARPPHA